MGEKIKNILVSLLVVVILPGGVVCSICLLGQRTGEPDEVKVTLRSSQAVSVDHSRFPILQQEFAEPQQVTEACLSCHNGRDDEIMATAHWKWERDTEIPGRGEVTIGKKNLLNNFCTGAPGNNGSCMRCHIGYGWKDKSFDFSDSRNIDCLVCHDNTETYFKQKGQYGYPATEETANAEYYPPDYNYVAQNVGAPTKNNCGICHFYGGGGNNVKHGDLEQAIVGCSREVDVHMSMETLDMACIDCHLTENHNITGRLYAVSASNTNRVHCEQCHGSSPHNDKIIDEHYIKVTCQTCHIPEYAKVNSTKMWWDWSTGGRLDEDGFPIAENDADGNHNYLSIKGNFVWDDHVVPEYQWFNGTADHYLLTDTISEIPVKMNELLGSYTDPASKIWPVKVHRGRQMYDTEYNYLISMKLWDSEEGNGAFWTDFNWDSAAVRGMEYANRPYSGSYDFVETEVSWPINHMVSPAENAVGCTECHRREDSRLAALDEFYLPARDRSIPVDYAGIGLIIVSLIGVFIHGLFRMIFSRRNKKSMK